MGYVAFKAMLVRSSGVLLLLLAPQASAAPCADFVDVDGASGFCANVEWLKNRQVTLGCATAVYCPDAAVSRLAMALTPTQLPVDVSPGAIDLDASAVVCQTQAFAVAGFPRRAYVDASFSGQATGDVGFAADLVMSSDGGANWTNLNTATNRGFVRANQWGAFADLGFVDLSVGQNVRWGMRMTRGGIAGSTDLADSRCQLRVLVYSRNGDASPF